MGGVYVLFVEDEKEEKGKLMGLISWYGFNVVIVLWMLEDILMYLVEIF